MIPISEITLPHQMDVNACRAAAVARLSCNLVETQNPFHHLTANAAIVDPDPTLEYYLGRLPEEERQDIRARWEKLIIPTAPKAIAVNRRYYGHDPYERL